MRARIVSVEPMAAAAARVQRGLLITVRSAEPLPLIGRHLANPGQAEAALGEVTIIARTADLAEAEIRLPGRYRVSPEVAGAIMAIPGIVTVEHL